MPNPYGNGTNLKCTVCGEVYNDLRVGQALPEGWCIVMDERDEIVPAKYEEHIITHPSIFWAWVDKTHSPAFCSHECLEKWTRENATI